MAERQEKPWDADNHARRIEEYHVLGQTEAFLGAQLRDAQQRRKVLKTEILDGILARTSEPPTSSDYGITETALDLETRAKQTPSVGGVIRNFKSKLIWPHSVD